MGKVVKSISEFEHTNAQIYDLMLYDFISSDVNDGISKP
jgi:hypothetical protein